MRPKPAPNYLAGYPPTLTDKIKQMIEQDQLADWLLRKYPLAHAVRSDKALYDYVMALKNSYMRNAGLINKVAFDSSLHLTRNEDLLSIELPEPDLSIYENKKDNNEND